MIDYGKMLSKTIQDIKPSGIRKFFDILSEMDDVVSLTVGQPDFITPWHIRESAIESLEKGKTYKFAVRPYVYTGSEYIWAKSYTSVTVKV